MTRFSVLAALLVALPGVAAEPDEPRQKPRHDAAPVELSLTAAQQQAVGIRTEYPVPLATAPPIEAYGTVLDPLALATDAGRMESTEAAASAAAADAARQERLYRDEAQASL